MIEMQHLSRKEKIRLMEAIWADLSKEDYPFVFWVKKCEKTKLNPSV